MLFVLLKIKNIYFSTFSCMLIDFEVILVKENFLIFTSSAFKNSIEFILIIACKLQLQNRSKIHS